MTDRQLIAGVVAITFLFLCIIELVRRGRLREEYTWVWMLAGVAMVLLTAVPGMLRAVADMIGAWVPASAAYFLALLFLLAINLHYAVVISKLSMQIKNLCQHQALMAHHVDALRDAAAARHVVAALPSASDDRTPTEPPA